MGNWYRVTKTINGRRYDYWQRTKRVGKSVKTENKYIGPAGSSNVPAPASHDPFAHARFGSPTFIPKTGYLPEAQRYVNEWGTVAYGDKRSAELYAADLEKGEGGTYRAERETPNGYWRAHRITTTPPTPSQFDPTFSNYHNLNTDEKKAVLKPLGRFPVHMPNEPTGTEVTIRSLDLPERWVVDTIKEAPLPDGTTYRYVEFHKSNTTSQHERTVSEHTAAIEQSRPLPKEPEKPAPDERPKREDYTREEWLEILRERRERKKEYAAGMARENKQLRAAKRKAKGLKIANPYLAALFKK